jgi:glycine/D-amino acid oxidase-like deaminating enzyme/nitrite reductase/ring-hydroxylating ferredoxin subunit
VLQYRRMAHLEAKKNTSLWLDTAPQTGYPPLEPGRHFDVAVLGGGIAGITTAYLLERQGANVALVEAGRIAGGVTAYTTAKVSSLHGTIFSTIARKHGAEAASTYAAANQLAREWMRARVDEHGIDCDWRAKPAFTYAEDASDVAKVEAEVEAAKAAGLPASYTEETDLPWQVAGAVRVEDQAEFHPRRYLLALAEQLTNVFEQTRATGVSAGSPNRVATTRGELTADHVVVATHFPFLDRAGFFARMHPERSYALGLRLNASAKAPQGMYLSTESPAHTVRSHPTPEGELVIAGGESHKVGQADEAERVQRLEAWARARFDVRSIEYRWSTQDNMPVDSLPYIGRMLPFQRGIWVATGFLKWGLTNGTAAGLILADLIAGRDNPWASLFDATRIKPIASASEFVKENVNVGKHFVGDHIAPPDARSLDEVPAGEGRLVRQGVKKVAAYRHDDGTLDVVSSTCTHLGCQVKWNGAEKSWDCPCHGSRFAPDGRVLQGPAVQDLAPVRDTTQA